MKNIEILHEDELSIVVNKPAGLAVQGGQGIKTSLDNILASMSSKPLLVHRLDKDTSGALLAAKGREAAALFSRLINNKKTVKKYIAVCAGRPKKNEGIITDELYIRGSLKKSITKFKVINSEKLTAVSGVEYSVLELELGTGRMHQIRRHLAMNGNPVLGDDKYGDFSLNKKLYKEAGLKRLLLHASRLIINDEIKLDTTAPLPEYFNPYTSSLN
ncbi:MAG: RluA family pseudouridine synthase [Treponema sp.]|nr:RluA family pseudouridine synthase [Treponema sp.]